jgi:lipopolysaccharide/colanic/teichoic acid biosynthesis glycosyltransferase
MNAVLKKHDNVLELLIHERLKSPYTVSYFYAPVREKPVQWAVKRIMDLVLGSLISCVVFVPLLLVAIAIKLESPGPIFFKQRRIGMHGEEFEMFKFRSMYQDAEARLKGDL